MWVARVSVGLSAVQRGAAVDDHESVRRARLVEQGSHGLGVWRGASTWPRGDKAQPRFELEERFGRRSVLGDAVGELDERMRTRLVP